MDTESTKNIYNAFVIKVDRELTDPVDIIRIELKLLVEPWIKPSELSKKCAEYDCTYEKRYKRKKICDMTVKQQTSIRETNKQCARQLRAIERLRYRKLLSDMTHENERSKKIKSEILVLEKQKIKLIQKLKNINLSSQKNDTLM